MRVGFGYDSHRFVDGRRLILGGVNVPSEKGLLGHSDGDVLCHAIIDSILGALGAGDIGKYFPDSDPKWKDASSIEMLEYIIRMAQANGYYVEWIDSTIITEKPRLADHMESMKGAISASGIPADIINIKAKTNEGMGFIGRGEGVAAQAVCLLRKI